MSRKPHLSCLWAFSLMLPLGLPHFLYFTKQDSLWEVFPVLATLSDHSAMWSHSIKHFLWLLIKQLLSQNEPRTSRAEKKKNQKNNYTLLRHWEFWILFLDQIGPPRAYINVHVNLTPWKIKFLKIDFNITYLALTEVFYGWNVLLYFL